MMAADVDSLLDKLARARRLYPDSGNVLRLLGSLARVRISDAALLARFHDALLFLCAYPASPAILKRAEALLRSFARRVPAIDDVGPLLDPELSGIAGTKVEVIFSYDFVRWLADRFPGELDIDWDDQRPSESFGWILPLLLPVLEEEASVDANVPFLAWLRAAGALRRDGGLAWLLEAFADLASQVRPRQAPPDVAALYDSLGLWIRWSLRNSPITRTHMRRARRKIFYQQSAIVARRDVSIDQELGRPLVVRKLSRREGQEVLDLARAAMATRYRELYSFTWGDPATVLSADAGRGLEIVLIGLLPHKRLPLRAGFAPFILRNGVPIGYGDAFGLCERMEVSYNIFYAFRDGESAFSFARLLALYHQLFGSTSFSIDPYQIGLGNEEAIDAGAFWFYRKLGFRSIDAEVERLALREERRMTGDPAHRTSARTLRRMAGSALIYSVADERGRTSSDWDRFHIRNIGLNVAKRFGSSGQSTAAFTESSIAHVASALNMRVRSLKSGERHAFEQLAPTLAVIPGLDRWSDDERAGVRQIIRAKAAPREDDYLHLLAAHKRLRTALLRLGKR